MKVTSQLLYAEFVNSQNLNPQKSESEATDRPKVADDQQTAKFWEEDILNITRENKKAVITSLAGLLEAIEKLNSLKSEILSNPQTALAAQGNISADSVASLL